MSKNYDAAVHAYKGSTNPNLIMNGGFSVAQRGSFLSSAGTGTYLCDRWMLANTTAAVLDVLQSTNTSVQTHAPLSGNSYTLDITTSDAVMGAGDILYLQQRIEGLDFAAARFGYSVAKGLVLTFKTAHTKTGTYCVSLFNSAINRSYIAEYVQQSADTWEQHEIVIPGDTAGTWLVGANEIGLALRFVYAADASTGTWLGTAGSWTSTNDAYTSNQVNAADNIANYMRLADVKLEIADYATPFEVPTFEVELQRCKRFWQQNTPYGILPADAATGALPVSEVTAYGGTTAWRTTISFEVEMASTPTMSYYRTTVGSTAGQWQWYSSSWADTTALVSAGVYPKCFTPQGTITGGTSGYSYLCYGIWAADAEL